MAELSFKEIPSAHLFTICAHAGGEKKLAKLRERKRNRMECKRDEQQYG